MKKITWLTFLLLSLNTTFSFAQSYPPYSITVCDTNVSSGYYFTCPFSNAVPAYPHTQMILDSLGRVVYYHAIHGTSIIFCIQPDNLMCYNTVNTFYLMDSTFTVVDSITAKNGIFDDNHEMQVLPNGHFLVLGYEYVNMDLSAYHYFNHNGSPGSTNAHVKVGVIQEQDSAKNVVFEWHAKDYFSFSDVDSLTMNSPSNVDWTHCNALALDTDGNILLSSRHQNEITKINRSDSSIMWRLGGKRNQFTFVNDSAQFLLQHDVRRIANGNITLFDNGRHLPFHASAGKEYHIDENAMTATLVWSYCTDTSTYSQAMGNVQRLPNGNTMVDDGIEVSLDHPFDLVDSSGNKIFEIHFPDSLWSYRSFNYLTLPWQLPRPQISCYSVGNQSYLDAGPGYALYKWSNGATTQVIPVNVADTFNVFVPIGNGGFISSDYLIVTNILNPCGPLSENNLQDETVFSIYPNPVSDQLVIQSSSLENNCIAEIFDFTGKKILDSKMTAQGNEFTLPVSNLAPGIYLVRINGVSKKFVKM